MSDLNDLWNEASQNFSDQALTDAEILTAIREESRNPMQALRRQVRIKFWFCTAFTPAFIALLLLTDFMVAKVLLLVLYVGYLVAAILYWEEQNRLKKEMNHTQNLRRALENYYTRVVRVMRVEENIGLFFYPVAIIAGMLVQGAFLGNRFPDSLSDWVFIIVAITVMTPLLHFLAKKMNQKAFDAHLEKLRQNIDTLEEVELRQ